jgi:hypothetical protein
LVFHTDGRTWIDGVLEQGAQENVGTQDEISGGKLEKIA